MIAKVLLKIFFGVDLDGTTTRRLGTIIYWMSYFWICKDFDFTKVICRNWNRKESYRCVPIQNAWNVRCQKNLILVCKCSYRCLGFHGDILVFIIYLQFWRVGGRCPKKLTLKVVSFVVDRFTVVPTLTFSHTLLQTNDIQSFEYALIEELSVRIYNNISGWSHRDNLGQVCK